MRILVCPDKYKSSLSATKVAEAMEKGLLAADSTLIVDKAPMADGGDGTVDAFLSAMGGQKLYMQVTGPLLEQENSFFGILKDNATAVIEMAAASGLAMVPPGKRNPMQTTSYGTGELIRRALDCGVKKIVIGIGGSATNEGGMGMMAALGMRFFSKDGAQLTSYTASDMLRVARAEASGLDARLKDVQIEVACDVNNPLCGESGASAIFGPQKGATPEMIAVLDKSLFNFAQCLYQALGVNILDIPGSGAAGGMGGALTAIGGKLRMGTDIVIDVAHLKERVKLADLVITGEGATDKSTPFGKVPVAMGKLAQDAGIQCICIAGSVLEGYKKVYEMGVTAVFSILSRPMSMDSAVKNCYALVRDCTENVARAMGL